MAGAETAQPGVGAAPDGVAMLDRAASPAFADLTYGSLAAQLFALDAPWFAVGARSGGRPVGLALGSVGEDGAACLISLFVRPGCRAGGIGRDLVSGFTDAARRRGAERLSIRLSGTSPSRPAVAAVLARLGWPPLRCVEVRVAGLAGAMSEAVGRWSPMERRVLRRSAVSYDGWGPFGEADRTWLAALKDEGLRVPDEDALAGRRVEPRVCVAIRQGGALAGWLMGYRAASPLPDYADAPAIRYAGAHMAPGPGRDGALVGAFWHAGRRQADAFGPRSVASYHTAMPSLVSMTRRRFAAVALKVEEVHGTMKVL